MDTAGNNAVQVRRTVTVAIANPTGFGADGLSPLMKYALGANSPSDTVQAPVVSATSNTLVLTAMVRIDAPKIQCDRNNEDRSHQRHLDDYRREWKSGRRWHHSRPDRCHRRPAQSLYRHHRVENLPAPRGQWPPTAQEGHCRCQLLDQHADFDAIADGSDIDRQPIMACSSIYH
jgi:hypothetical protein